MTVKELVRFGSDTTIQMISVNQSEIYLDIHSMTHDSTFFKNLEFLLEAARKPSSQLTDVLHSKLADQLMMNAQLLNMMQKGNLAFLKQIINDADVASTVVCQQADQLQQLVITQQKKNALELILKTVVYLKSISELEVIREYLIDRLQQLDYFETAA